MIRSREKKAKERKALRMAVMVTQLGISMMCPVFICVFLGRWCSEKTGHPLLFLFFLLVGIMAGFRSCWQIILRFTGPDLQKGNTGQVQRERWQDEVSDDEESDEEEMDKMV